MGETMGEAALVVARGQTTARFVVRGGAAGPLAIAALLQALPPSGINRASTNASASRAALMLGPDEWLLLASDILPDALEQELASAVAGNFNSLVDVTHRQTGIEVSGPTAAMILNHAMPLDLSLTTFPVGMATRTYFEKAEIVLWRQAEQAFHIEVWRSFAPYVEALLQAFARENAATR